MTKNNKKQSEKKSKDFSVVRRAGYVLAFVAMLAIGAYFTIMVNSPDPQQKVLASFAVASAINYFYLAIK